MTYFHKYAARIFVFALTIAAALTVLVVLLLGTQPGRDISVGLINRLASTNEQRIELQGLESVFGTIKLKSLHLADQKGVWLAAENFSADYSWSDLFSFTLISKRIHLDSLSIERSPLADASSKPANTNSFLSYIQAVRASIKQLSIDDISLGDALLGIPARLSLSSQFQLDHQPLSLTGMLHVKRIDGVQGTIDGKWDFKPSQERRFVELNLIEPGNGLMARLLGIAGFPSVKISIAGDGPANDWHMQSSIMLDNKLIAEGQGLIRLQGENKAVSLMLNGQLASLLPTSFAPLMAGNTLIKLEANETDQRISLDHLSLTSDDTRLKAQGTVDLRSNQVSLTSELIIGRDDKNIILKSESGDITTLGSTQITANLEGAIKQAALNAKGSMAHLNNQAIALGPITWTMDGSKINLENGQGIFITSLHMKDVKTQNSTFDRLLMGDISIDAKAKHASNGILIDSASLTAKNVSAQFSGSIEQSDLSMKGIIIIPHLDDLHASLSGKLENNIKITGTIAEPQLSAEIAGHRIILNDKPLDHLKAHIETNTISEATIALNAAYNGAPIRLQAKLQADANGEPNFGDIVLSAPGASIKGDVTRKGDGGLLHGDLNVNITDFAQFGPLLLQPDLSGALKGSIQFSADNQRQRIDLAAKANTLAIAKTTLQNLTLKASLLDPFVALSADGHLSIGTVMTGGEHFEGLEMTAHGNQDHLPITLKGQLDGAPIFAQGFLKKTDERLQFTFQQLNASWRSIALALEQPSSISMVNGITTINPLTLQVDRGQATLAGTISDQFDLTLHTKAFPLSIVDKIAPSSQGPSGQITANATFQGPISSPTINWQLNLDHLSLKATRDAALPELTLAANGRFHEKNLTLQSQFSGGGLDLGVGGTVNIDANNLDITVKGKVPFSIAAGALSQSAMQLDGDANVSAKISGPLSEPNIDGTIATQNARFSELSSGLIIDELSGSVQLSQKTATFSNLRGRIGQEGSLSIKGSIGLDPTQYFPADIQIIVTKGRFSHDTLLTTNFDANIKVIGNLAETGKISGNVQLIRTDITIPDHFTTSLSPISVLHKNTPKAVAAQVKSLQPPESNDSDAGPAMMLDLTIASPHYIYVRGRGLDAELGGNIHIDGTTTAPHPVGTVSLIRGRINILTKRFDFEDGSINFSGMLDPALDFKANIEKSGTRYSISVGGYASSPTIEFSSVPDMPQDEILAQIFFGRDLNNLSPLQIAQLANAIAEISGTSSASGGILSQLRALSGLDDIDIRASEDGEGATVGVGRYLNDRTYVNVEQGTSADSSKVTINLDITDNLKARGAVGADGRTKAGIFYEKDY